MAEERFHRLAVERDGLALDAQHRRLRGAVDVGVQDAHVGAFVREREREVRGDRRLADAALAGAHRDDVLDAAHHAEGPLDLVRDDVLRDVHRHVRRTRGLEAFAHALAHGLRAVTRRIAELDRDRDVAVVGDLQALQHVRGNVVDLHHGVLETREGRAKRFGGDHELLLHPVR